VKDPIAVQLIEFVSAHKNEIVKLLVDLAQLESPSLVPETQAPVQHVVENLLGELGFEAIHIPGDKTGGHIQLSPKGYENSSSPSQVLLGHTDTVWPLGTLERMPVEIDEKTGAVRGPGVFDMKGGIVQIVFALRALAELGLHPEVKPLVFLNSDEEIGSIESQPHVEKLAKSANRVLVLEPALGTEGKIKTTRRGFGRFKVRVIGKASHSGLAPEEGVSAIQEMSHVIQTLHGLADADKGIGVNVGTISGGTRANVVAAECSVSVDVRITNLVDAHILEEAIKNIEPITAGTHIEVEGGIDRGPMEATPRNQNLWQSVRECGRKMDIELLEGLSGGASDGNTTSLYTATVDGLGAVGDGAHAYHEYVNIDRLLERTALLALVIMLPQSDI
tara:strand:- start:627 stop:1799 length:1173 start_codon:yes stop_codon:yes gene_type:complete